MKQGDQRADDSYLGYVAQGLYALVVLFGVDDGEGVSIETRDDIEVIGAKPSLLQLKHSMGTPDAVTIKNDGLWATIRIWSLYVNEPISKFIFVTCAMISEGSELMLLDRSQQTAPLTPQELDKLVAVFETEAQRVLQARADAKAAGERLPFQERGPACEAFMALSPHERRSIIRRMVVRPGSMNAEQIGAAIEHELSGKVVAAKRLAITTRVMEWWQQQVYLCLLNKRSRVIYKHELEAVVHELIAVTHDSHLPDDYSRQSPEAWESLVTPTIRAQIDLVKGGTQRLSRSVVEMWRASNQRRRWLHERLEDAQRLEQFDEQLEREWKSRHDDMAHDLCDASDDELVKAGKQLLDWSHYDAPSQMIAPRPTWREPFLVRGSFQWLSDRLRVGWHRDYKAKIHLALSKKSEGTDT